MEVRRLIIFTAFFVVAVFTQYSDGHNMHRRQADDQVNFEDTQGDEGYDVFGTVDTQNDTGDRAPAQIAAPSKIITLPQKYQVRAGATARLECIVEPESTIVQWWRNDELYFMGKMKAKFDLATISIVSNTKDLMIKNVSIEDAGIYRCQITQKSGESISVNHTLEVEHAPIITRVTATNNGNLTEGANLLLTCESDAVPKATVMWSRDIANMNSRLNENDGEMTEKTIYIKNVNKNHSGKYYCYVLNDIGHAQAEIDVVVQGNPRVHVHKTRVNSAINIEAVLQCTAYDEAIPHMRWYKDGRLIEDSSTQYAITTNGHHSNLTVTPQTAIDFGTFTCEAENFWGKHNRSIELVQNPVIEDVNVEGPKVTWTVHSHQPLEELELQLKPLNTLNSEWIRYSVPVPTTSGHRFEFIQDLQNNVQPGKYEVQVKAKNSDSWGSAPEPIVVDIVAPTPIIEHASVFGANPSSGHSNKLSSVVLSSFAMYLLVRMF